MVATSQPESPMGIWPFAQEHNKIVLKTMGWDCKAMPWKKGTSGNPNGNPGKDKLFRTSLIMELKTRGQDMPELRRIARKCIDLAIGGESWAVKEICDRLDGKAPHSSPDIAEEDSRPAAELTDDE